MREKNAIIICALICVTLIIGGVLFWPSLFRYDKIEGKFPVRINRLTGYTEILYDSGWERKVSDNELQAIPKAEISKIEVIGSFDGKRHYKFTIYNGCEWNIKSIKLSIGLKDGNGKILWERIYKTTEDVKPFSTSSGSINMMDYAAADFIPAQEEREVDKRYKEVMALLQNKSEIRIPEVRLEEALGYKSK
jgi:hypothetical protein